MKRIITLITVFAFFSGAIHAQNQQAEPDFYTQYLLEQVTVAGITRIVQNAAEDGASPGFYANALDRFFYILPNIHDPTEIRIADELVLFLSAKLGEAQYTDAGLNLWRIVENFSNPLVQAEALMALGRTQAMEFLPGVIQILVHLNDGPDSDRIAQEQVAYGAITSLEAYKDSSGYLPVFFASVGWYSERITLKAASALPNITDNPTEHLISVIRGVYPVSTKLRAIQVLEGSQVTNQEKAQGAVASFDVAWGTSVATLDGRIMLATIRKFSMNMIRRYGTEDPLVYTLLERSYRTPIDMEEQIIVIATLAALASDDSVRVLGSFISDINTRMRLGTLTADDERRIRVIIPALGETRRPSAREPLRSILQYEWTSAVQVMTQEALRNIP